MKEKKLPPIHPGEILMEEFLALMGISQPERVWVLVYRRFLPEP